jgi:predicted RecA/RadA family phage recombinase
VQRKRYLSAVAIILGIALPIGVALPADAATPACAEAAPAATAANAQPNTVCCQSTYYSTSNGGSVHMRFLTVPVFRDGPGGTLTVTKSYSGSVSATISSGASVSVSGVVASAQVSVSASLTGELSTSATNQYSRKITSGKYGNAEYISYGDYIKWAEKRTNSNCTTTTLASGVLAVPTHTQGWYYWETSS